MIGMGLALCPRVPWQPAQALPSIRWLGWAQTLGGLSFSLRNEAQVALENADCRIMVGNERMALAKMIGITPE